MAVISVEELRAGRSSSHDETFQRTYTRLFRVLTDDPHTGGFAVRAALGFTVGAQYQVGTPGTDPWAESDTGAFCTAIRAECVEDGCEWTVTAEYGPWTPKNENPLLDPEELEYGGAQFERVIDFDINGDPICNSAGDWFDPPVTIDDSRPTFTVTRNEGTFDRARARQMRDKLNAALFYDYAPGTVKCGFITGQRLWHAAIGFYYKVRYPFDVNEDGWDRTILDQGYRYLSGSQRKQILVDGSPATSPVPLDGAGGQLAVGGTPVGLAFTLYESADFSTFGFTGA